MPDAAPGAGKDRGRRSGKRTRPDPDRPGALPDGNKNAPAGRQPHKGQRKIKNKTSIEDAVRLPKLTTEEAEKEEARERVKKAFERLRRKMDGNAG